MRCTPCPSERSRTVPMKLVTAPTPPSPARSAATSAERSKSASEMSTRGVGAMSASGDGGKEGEFVAVGQHHGLVAQLLVARGAQRAGAGQGRRMRFPARDQAVAQFTDRAGVGQFEALAGAEGLAQRGEETK